MSNRDPQIRSLAYRRASVREILELRREILIAGTDRSSAVFEGDYEKGTIHFGVFASGKAIGCLSLLRNSRHGEPAFQLRGMAVLTDWQRCGIGSRLLEEAERYVLLNTTIRLLWCNARKSALAFYEKAGWKPVSAEFLIPGVGPHIEMVKRLPYRPPEPGGFTPKEIS